MAELAYKRIPVTKEIWEALSNLKGPGETYAQLLAEMIALKQERDFLAHIEEIEKTGRLVSLEEAARELNINDVKT
jgi:ribosomal protein S13